jgi:hypothetical protein
MKTHAEKPGGPSSETAVKARCGRWVKRYALSSDPTCDRCAAILHATTSTEGTSDE